MSVLITAEALRAMGKHLLRRYAGPSLDGYALADGLFAAADLLDGLPGPKVHADFEQGRTWPPHIDLKELPCEVPVAALQPAATDGS